MAENKIQVDLVADLKLALDKLGMGRDIEKAANANPGLVNAIGKGLGLDIQKVIAQSAAKGLAQGLSKIPPIIVPTTIPKKSIWDHLKTLGEKGGLMGGFGRYEIGRAAMDALGMGGGVGGRLGGAALAGFGGKVPGLTAAVAGAALALEGLRLAARKLIEAVEQGARLYEQSRAIGRSTLQTSSYLKTLGVVGVDEGTAMRLARVGQFGAKGSQFRSSVSGEMIGAAMRSGLIQEAQQIANMSKDIDEAARKMRVAAVATANVARQNFETIMAWRVFQNDFKTFWQQMAGIFGGVATTALQIAHVIADITNAFIFLETRMLQGFRGIGEYIRENISSIPKLGKPGQLDSGRNPTPANLGNWVSPSDNRSGPRDSLFIARTYGIGYWRSSGQSVEAS